jgi:hypothetical protein
MAVFNPPTHLAAEEFERKLEAFVDSVLALPVVKKIITKYELVCIFDWFPLSTAHTSLPVFFAG